MADEKKRKKRPSTRDESPKLVPAQEEPVHAGQELPEYAPKPEPAQEAARWELEEPCKFVMNGTVILLAKGSIVSESTHDVMSLVEQGANLKKL